MPSRDLHFVGLLNFLTKVNFLNFFPALSVTIGKSGEFSLFAAGLSNFRSESTALSEFFLFSISTISMGVCVPSVPLAADLLPIPVGLFGDTDGLVEMAGLLAGTAGLLFSGGLTGFTASGTPFCKTRDIDN